MLSGHSLLLRASALLVATAFAANLPAQTIAPAAANLNIQDLPVVTSKVDCASLAAADLSRAVGASTRITAATVVDEGKTTAYCKVQVQIEEFANSEVHLPVSGWTQRFLGGGGGTGQAVFATMTRSDIGHRGDEDAFANNYKLRIDFAYRIVHLQVLAAKALITTFYGQGPRFSYYNACSEPGREGMMEVQRFPEDYNGAITGCPPINDTINQGIYEAWNIVTNTRADGSLIITSDKLSLLHKAVLDECDALDGAKDGIVSVPWECHPKLTAIVCKQGQDPGSCITAEQQHVALELYRGAHDDKGNKLEPFGVLPGSEPQWTAVIAPAGNLDNSTDRKGTTLALRSEMVDPALGTSWKLSDMKFDRASFDTFTKMHYLFDATNPDLSAYAKAGHKLIVWQGLADNNVLPAHTILFYTALQKTMGAKAVDDFARLYVLPGVGHCGGGDGPSIRDFLSPMMSWVEKGVAPGALPAAHAPQPARGAGGRGGQGGPGGPAAQGGQGGPGAGGPGGPGGPGGAGGGFMMQGMQQIAGTPDLTRPIYPYPYTQKYTGNGDVKEAANFVQGPARPAPASVFNWFGADFYKAGPFKWCTASGPTTMDCKDSR
jgi:feruloyl esterase